nr:hypothetical protein [uncultured Mediterraneibacter sp.]
MKLAEVLDIGTDELLACKYDTFNHKRKDLFAMDEKIISKAELKMKELYGEQLPISISNRFKTEELMLKNQMMLRWMGFLGELHDRFYEEDDFFLVRGAQMGSSFIAWLLGATNVNPLPAHYYCPKCKKIEFVSNVKCGLDAPDKKCSCGTAYEKDGFGIDAIHMYPLFGGCDINISDGAKELAKECFKDYFCEYSEIREIKIQKSEAEEENINKGQLTNVVRYILVPREVAVQYPGEILTLSPEEYFQKFSKFERLMIVEDPQEHSSFKEIENIKISVVNIQDYLKYAVEKKKFKIDYLEKDLNEFASKLLSASFTELLAIEGCLHGTGVWEENGEKLYIEGIPLSELITNREDAYTYLYSKLNGKCCDNPSGQVYEIVKNLQKGIYAGKGIPADLEQLLLENEVPEWYIDSMKKIHYIFPKAHLITYLKRDISNYISTKRNGEALVQK